MQANGASYGVNRPSLAYALGLERIPGLDSLRAIAVLLVVIDHSGFYQIGSVAVFDGSFGVEIFFVLSGFIITWMLLEELARSDTIHMAEFYRRRAARLLPVFYLYLLGGAFLLLVFGRPVPWSAVAAAAVYVINYYQAATGGAAHYISHCWSLAVEEQFYLLWPIGIRLLHRKRLSLPHALLFIIFSTWCIRWGLTYLGASDEYLYRALETRLDQLALGCLVAALVRTPLWQSRVESIRRLGLTLALLLVVACFSLTYWHASLPLKYGLAYSIEPLIIALVIPLYILWVAAGGMWVRILQSKAIVSVGKVSYGMYLFHPFVIHPTRHLLMRHGMPIFISVLLSIVVLYAIAYVSFTYFESPLRSMIREHGGRPKARSSVA